MKLHVSYTGSSPTGNSIYTQQPRISLFDEVRGYFFIEKRRKTPGFSRGDIRHTALHKP